MRTRTVLTIVIESTDAAGYEMANKMMRDWIKAGELLRQNVDVFGPGAAVDITTTVAPLPDEQKQ
jgi:hypothetical protein